MAGCISICRFWASPHEDMGSLCSGARYSLGPIGLPPIVVTHFTALMQFGSQKRHFEMHPQWLEGKIKKLCSMIFLINSACLSENRHVLSRQDDEKGLNGKKIDDFVIKP